MSSEPRKTRFWNKGFIISFFFLILTALIVILFLVNRFFFSIQWVDYLYDLIIPIFSMIFYEYNIIIYVSGLISFVLLLVIFVLGYNIAKIKHLTGSVIYVFSLFGFVLTIFILVNYSYIGILSFRPEPDAVAVPRHPKAFLHDL